MFNPLFISVLLVFSATDSYVPECVTQCEKEFVARVSYHVNGAQSILDSLSTGELVFNGSILESVCNAYIPIRSCTHTCKDPVALKIAWDRLFAFEKLCIRKNWAIMRRVPCYERISKLFDPACLQRCHCEYHNCGPRWQLFNYAQDWVRTVNSKEDFYELSRVLHRFCGCSLTRCQLFKCQMPHLLNYCSPEAAFMLEEFAGTPLVPMQEEMRKLNAFDYWPDFCRELARASANRISKESISQLIIGILIIFSAETGN